MELRFRHIKKTLALLTALTFFPFLSFAEDADDEEEVTSYPEALIQGFESYRTQDWTSATIFLRRAVADPSNMNDNVLYMLIMSQMYSRDFSSAVSDADSFLNAFHGSRLEGAVQYQKGRALHELGQNDRSVLVLSDFCRQYPESDMYPLALYWMGECFYDDYNFDIARGLYERVLNEYPSCPKVAEAGYRLDLITQRKREEKLLYLLKMTGEEYLSYQENNEKMQRANMTDDFAELREQLEAARKKIRELEDAERARRESEAALVTDIPEHNEPEYEEPEATFDFDDYTAGYDAGSERNEVAAVQAPASEYVLPAGKNDGDGVLKSAKKSASSADEMENLKTKAASLQKIVDQKNSRRRK